MPLPASDHPTPGPSAPRPILTLSLPGGALRLETSYSSPMDTLYITLHDPDWATVVRLVVAGRAEQRALLRSLEPIVSELRHRHGSPEAA